MRSIPTLKTLSGRQIPVLGCGTYQTDPKKSSPIVLKALEIGYRLFDTANFYKNENQFKQAVSESGVQRIDMFITSKVSPMEQGYDRTKKAILTHIERSGLAYLDLALVLWPGVYGPKALAVDGVPNRLGSWKALCELKEQGLIRDVGVSNFLKKHLEHLYANSSERPIVNQLEVHPMLWSQATIEFCRRHNILIQAYSPVARGNPKLLSHEVIVNMAAKYAKTPAQICLRWGIEQGFIVIPKSSSEERLKQNIGATDFTLAKQDVAAISNLHTHNLRICWDPNTVAE